MGYMAPGLGALCVLSCVGLAIPLLALGAPVASRQRLFSRVAVVVLIAFGVEHVARNHPAVDLRRFVATDAMDDLRVRSLPPRALLVATMPQTVFRLQELWVVDRVRPDVALLALPLASYPGAVEALQRRSPELAGLAAAFQATGRLSPAALSVISTQRPVLIELDAHLPLELYPSLVPVGGAHALVDPGIAPVLWPSALATQRRAYARLGALLGEAITERETARQILYMRFMDAVHAAALGRRAAAQEALQAAMRLAPEDIRLRAFARALETLPEGQPLDVGPWLGTEAPR
jgi:hypothetical protein